MKNIKTYTASLNEAEDQEELNNMFLDAVRKRNIENVKELLDMGAQIDAVNKYGRTPLLYAALNGHTDIVKLLLDRGAEVDARDEEGWAPLRRAVNAGITEMTKLLIQHGADPFKAFKDPTKVLEYFEGDIDWMPEGPLKTKLKRMQRGKSAFGM